MLWKIDTIFSGSAKGVEAHVSQCASDARNPSSGSAEGFSKMDKLRARFYLWPLANTYIAVDQKDGILLTGQSMHL